VENGAYGLYPVECENVLVEESEVVGASDAGIYVGQSEHIVVRNNIAHGNVAGIEIENCANADVFGNEAYDNTGGLLVFDLPDLPAGNGGRIKVHDNLVRENNRENFATVGTIVSFVPPGTGMLVLAADEVEIHENEIRDNQGTGIILFSFQTVEAVGGGSSEDDPSFDPYLETTFIHDNTFSGNGTMPRDLLELVAQGASTLEDIQWDGIVRDGRDASTLCIRNNGEATFRNFELDPSTLEFGEPSFDLAPHDCVHPALPAVSLDL
jgi:parallel beta-helix repeat protein